MRVLVISRNAWDDANAIGNTLSNFFCGIDTLEFASVYFREADPDNVLCRQYYRVTEMEVIKKWLSPKKIGRSFVWERDSCSKAASTAQKSEKNVIRFIRTHNVRLAYEISDRVWYSQKWLNQNFRDFIEEFCPDLMVTFVKSAPQYYLTVKFLRENYHIPLFSWIADDEYTALTQKKSKKNIRNLKYILSESVAVCGCSQEICDYYNTIFGCHATPLYKGCDLTEPIKKNDNRTLKIVYAGNLLYGRLEIIKKIAEYLEDYGLDGGKVAFDIYSNTLLSHAEQEYFRQKGFSKYNGRQDYLTVKQRLSEADIVLHVESFDAAYILQTKYSFSTKIIDCLQSGSVLLAVGPKELASISYANRIPGAYVIDDMNDLQSKLIKILNDKSALPERAMQIRSFAKSNHDASSNAERLKKLFETIV